LIPIFGFDFTSAPSVHKSITQACAVLVHGTESAHAQLLVSSVARLTTFAAFEKALSTPGPWVAGFDFPFGLPRELVSTLGWPDDWARLVSHVRDIGKPAFKAALNAVRESRPMGARYIARRGDLAAGASSPMKLVNPPVGLMFFEGAQRLLSSKVSVIPCAPAAERRIALEAYPGFLARQIIKKSYKKDGREGSTPERRAARGAIVHAITTPSDGAQLQTKRPITVLDAPLRAACIEDGSGDTLDSVLCALQAAVATLAYLNGDTKYGIPEHADALEGWISAVP
jgi:hypothetical protein